jgi:hypothetical protein
MTAQVVRVVVGPVLSALVELHSRGIVHRDLKLENLVFSHGKLKASCGSSAAQHSIAQHSTAQHSTPGPEAGEPGVQPQEAQGKEKRNAAQHSSAQHSTAQHSTQHSTVSGYSIPLKGFYGGKERVALLAHPFIHGLVDT